jgi:predicted nuclease of predicted toxin-antitoxin system
VTKDADFSDLSLMRRSPPRVIRIRAGNCTTAQVEALMRHYFEAIVEFELNAATGTLELLPA